MACIASEICYPGSHHQQMRLKKLSICQLHHDQNSKERSACKSEPRGKHRVLYVGRIIIPGDDYDRIALLTYSCSAFLKGSSSGLQDTHIVKAWMGSRRTLYADSALHNVNVMIAAMGVVQNVRGFSRKTRYRLPSSSSGQLNSHPLQNHHAPRYPQGVD